MLVQSSVAGDSRVLREATALVEAGHDVSVIGRDVPEGFVPPAGVSVLSVARSSGLGRGTVTSRGRPTPGTLRRVTGLARRGVRWALLPEHRERVERGWCAEAREAAVRAGPFDAVHAHDFNTLALAAGLAARWDVPYVYDSHEYWTGRPRVGRPTPWLDRRVRRAERELGTGAAAVITVGEGVARALADVHGFSGVQVVRNTFPDPEGPLEPPSTPVGLVYAGRLAADRELEVIAAASREVDLPVTLIGPADPAWLDRFDAGRATILPSGSLDDVDRLLAEAGIALVTHSDRWPNHRLAMPNKLFHAVRAGVPVVATDVGELAREVRAHGVGALYRPGDVAHMLDAIEDVRTDYQAYLKRVRAAREEMSWAVDARVLASVYAGLGTPGHPRDDR